MKIVRCKKCDAKYQIDDDEDIVTYECSACTGELELVEYIDTIETKKRSRFYETIIRDNSYIVKCENCGLKYKLQNNESILDFECSNCGGFLRYLDDESNEELEHYIDENLIPSEEVYEDHKSKNRIHDRLNKYNENLKEFSNQLEEYFSEDEILKIAEEEYEENEIDEYNEINTAKTTIPEHILSKFGKEFAVPKTNDYTILKNFLKYEFIKDLNKIYNDSSNTPATKKNKKSFLDRISLSEPEGDDIIEFEDHNSDEGYEEEFVIPEVIYEHIVLIIGIIIFILSIIEIFTTNGGIGIIFLFAGVILIIFGIYKTKDDYNKEPRKHKKVIREHLLKLPGDFYIFYNIKIPTSPSNINHLIVGPTGIYAILSKKYKTFDEKDIETALNLFEENETKNKSSFPNTIGRFRYTRKINHFSKDNEIKQKTLSLCEDLINFLNDNGIRNCFVEPLVGFVNNDVVVINMPLTDEDLFIDELIYQIENSIPRLNQETVDKCAVLINKYSADCSDEP